MRIPVEANVLVYVPLHLGEIFEPYAEWVRESCCVHCIESRRKKKTDTQNSKEIEVVHGRGVAVDEMSVRWPIRRSISTAVPVLMYILCQIYIGCIQNNTTPTYLYRHPATLALHTAAITFKPDKGRQQFGKRQATPLACLFCII